jgi:two-component sensor histidine kinase
MNIRSVLRADGSPAARVEDHQYVTKASRTAKTDVSPANRAPRSRLLPRVREPLAQIAVMLGLVGAVTLGRLGLGLIGPGVASFSLYFPAILLTALVAGWEAGAAASVLSLAAAWALFGAFAAPNFLINLGLCAGASAGVVALAAHVGALMERLAHSEIALAHRNLHYDTLFSTMSEGFALCEAIRDDQARLSDYVVLEMNPALQKMLRVGPEAVGGKLSDRGGDQTAWLALCDTVLKTGTPRSFEYHHPPTGLWHEVHINRVTQTRMAQFFFDVTERKAAQAHQANLFEELNHRVKNNLTIVSTILDMQGRAGDPALRAELMKAVDRVQSIAEVHASLYSAHAGAEVDFGAYLESLCRGLSKSLLHDDRIQIVVEAQSAPMSADHAVPLGMVVNEVVTNAVKYAYPAPQSGVISVDFRREGAGALLCITDAGAGLPENFETKPGGLGVKLLRSMVTQVGGTLTIRRHPGATFEIRIPDHTPLP